MFTCVTFKYVCVERVADRGAKSSVLCCLDLFQVRLYCVLWPICVPIDGDGPAVLHSYSLFELPGVIVSVLVGAHKKLVQLFAHVLISKVCLSAF